MKKVGCVHADRPSGKSSVEKHSWDTCWQWLKRIPRKTLFHSLLGNRGSVFLPCLWNSCFIYGTLNTWCIQPLKGIAAISASWGSIMPVVLAAKITLRHWCSRTLAWQLWLPGEKRQQPSPHCVLRESSLWCHHCWTHTSEGNLALPTHSNSLVYLVFKPPL